MHEADGSALFPVEGLPAELTADDGSQAGTAILDEGPQVAGIDLTTGEERWRTRSDARPARAGVAPAADVGREHLRRARHHRRQPSCGTSTR